MAMIVEGLSKCPLCNTVLDQTREFLMTPPMITNTEDPLCVFSDTGIHMDCLNQNPFKDKLLRELDIHCDRLQSRPLQCMVDGLEISNPREALRLGMLTSDETEELYQFNYSVLNHKNMRAWPDYDRFVRVCEKFIAEDKWKGIGSHNTLAYILKYVKQIHESAGES